MECRGTQLAEPALNEEGFRAALTRDTYLRIQGRRSGHKYRQPSTIAALLFDENSPRIATKGDFDAIWRANFPDKSVDNVIIVTAGPLSHYILGSISSIMSDTGIYIEIAPWFKFMFDFTKISAGAEHSVADPAEIREYCEAHRCNDNIFKKIRADDTACLWIGARPGDHVRIVIPSLNSGYSIDYRQCVAA